MKVTASAVSLNVEDVAASSLFRHQHFGFAEVMAADGFASLGRHDIGMNVVYLRRGLPTLPGDQRDVHATGLILVFAACPGPPSYAAGLHVCSCGAGEAGKPRTRPWPRAGVTGRG